jgi:hypothetical protein
VGLWKSAAWVKRWSARTARHLVAGALGLLLFVSNQFTDFLLNFASEVLSGAFDLISIHGDFTQIVNELL